MSLKLFCDSCGREISPTEAWFDAPGRHLCEGCAVDELAAGVPMNKYYGSLPKNKKEGMQADSLREGG